MKPWFWLPINIDNTQLKCILKQFCICFKLGQGYTQINPGKTHVHAHMQLVVHLQRNGGMTVVGIPQLWSVEY